MVQEQGAGPDGAAPAAAAQQEDGALGCEQALPATSFIAVEYPGIVRNAQKALVTLGGEEAVASAGTYLKLALRPGEPLAHPIFGDRQNCKALLLRISRKRGAEGSGNGEAPAGTSAQIVGRIGSAFTFTGLADFQYLPTDSTYTTRDYSLSPAGNLPAKAEPTGVVEPLLCVPPMFSRSDVPFDYAYRQQQHKSGWDWWQGSGCCMGHACVPGAGFHTAPCLLALHQQERSTANAHLDLVKHLSFHACSWQ